MTNHLSVDYVFDAEPLIAIPYDEHGADRARDLVTEVYEETATGAISEVTATELVYKIGWIEADDRPGADELSIGRTDVQDYADSGIQIVPTTAYWDTAAGIKASGSISLGDAFAVALAVTADATLVVGADDDFEDLPVDVAIERFRSVPQRFGA